MEALKRSGAIGARKLGSIPPAMSSTSYTVAAEVGEVSVARRRFQAMRSDFAQAVGRRRLAWSLAKEELFSGLEFSRLGLVWLIIQPLLWMLAVLVLLRPTQVVRDPIYALYVAVGVVLYHGIQTFVTRGSMVFTREAGRILNIPLPLSLFVLKNAMLVVLELAITLPIVICTMIFATPPVGPAMLLAIPGLVIFFTFGIGVTLTLGTLATRITDIVQVTQSIMRVLLFLTPVFWQPEKLHGARHLFAAFNPLYYMLLVVRDPLMGVTPSKEQYLIAILCALVAFTVGILVFGRFRERIPMWI
jgi:ABC-type polysaccharide/polyol phosphate export permease